jgi:hypothetical protein
MLDLRVSWRFNKNRTVFLVVTPCSLEIVRRFGVIYFIHIHGGIVRQQETIRSRRKAERTARSASGLVNVCPSLGGFEIISIWFTVNIAIALYTIPLIKLARPSVEADYCKRKQENGRKLCNISKRRRRACVTNTQVCIT